MTKEQTLREQQRSYSSYLRSKELEVEELELNARRQAALTSLKRDFIEECNINDEYQRLFKIEQEKYAALQAAAGNITEVEAEPVKSE